MGSLGRLSEPISGIHFLSDRKKTVARMYDAKGWFFPKRVTFIIDETGTIQKIIRNVNVHTHGEDILEILSENH